MIDLQRWSGVTPILGIDLTDDRARVVVMERKGLWYRRYSSNFQIVDFFTCEFESNEQRQQKAEQLQRCLSEREIESPYTVSTLRSSAVKIITTLVPDGTENIREWIADHQDKLLRLPIASSELIVDFEILDRTENGILTEISFVRKNDVEEHVAFLEQCGIRLLSVGTGVRDVVNLLLLSGEGDILLFDSQSVWHAGVRNGKKSPIAITPRVIGKSVAEYRELFSVKSDAVFVGDGIEETESARDSHIIPIGIQLEYALAYGLAIKGFIPELSPVNVLSNEQRLKTAEHSSKSLFQRVAILCGGILFLLLSVQMMISMYIQNRIDKIDQQLSTASGVYEEVKMLEKQIATLRQKVEYGNTSMQRRDAAKILHDVARLVPNDVWLHSLTYDAKDQGKIILLCSGYSRSNEGVAEFLKNIEISNYCSNARLVKTGANAHDIIESVHSKNITFELTAAIR